MRFIDDILEVLENYGFKNVHIISLSSDVDTMTVEIAVCDTNGKPLAREVEDGLELVTTFVDIPHNAKRAVLR